MIERPRPERQPLLPPWVIPGVAIGAAVVVLAVGLSMWITALSSVTVPDVVGLDEAIARVQLADIGLDLRVGERPFDTAPEGTILAQTPDAGTAIAGDESVTVVVSAGTEEFEMPDVIGQSTRVAQAQLEQRGLVVRVDAIASEAPPGTVVSTNPGPGAVVRTADTVRLTIAAEGDASNALLPYQLDGLSVALDPSQVASGTMDAPLEVARRLSALLEASGSEVLITRSMATADGSPAGRSAELAGTAWSVVIGLDAPASGPSGLDVSILRQEAAPATYESSRLLADSIAEALREGGDIVSRGDLSSDTVLSAAQGTGARVRLGSGSSPDDTTAFRDPAWADEIARSIYRGLGERYGSQ